VVRKGFNNGNNELEDRTMIFLATDDATAAAASAGYGIYSILWLLTVIYGLICLFVPICIYLMSGRVKEMRDILRRMESLARKTES
jgi:hypothetical protein